MIVKIVVYSKLISFLGFITYFINSKTKANEPLACVLPHLLLFNNLYKYSNRIRLSINLLYTTILTKKLFP